jgi:hypothetical protein
MAKEAVERKNKEQARIYNTQRRSINMDKMSKKRANKQELERIHNEMEVEKQEREKQGQSTKRK